MSTQSNGGSHGKNAKKISKAALTGDGTPSAAQQAMREIESMAGSREDRAFDREMGYV